MISLHTDISPVVFNMFPLLQEGYERGLILAADAVVTLSRKTTKFKNKSGRLRQRIKRDDHVNKATREIGVGIVEKLDFNEKNNPPYGFYLHEGTVHITPMKFIDDAVRQVDIVKTVGRSIEKVLGG